MSEVDLLEVTCPRCQKRLRVTRDQIGKRVACSNPSCAFPIEVSELLTTTPVGAEAAGSARPLLRLLATVYLVAAIVCFIGALAAVGWAGFLAGHEGFTWAGLLLPLLGALAAAAGGVAALTFAALLRMTLTLERHTRNLHALVSRQRPPASL